MTLLTTILAETHVVHEIPMPPLAYGAVALAVFLVLGVATWTYRDVANRHSQKFNRGGHDTHDAGH